MGLLGLAVGDAIATFLWVFCSAWLGTGAMLLLPYIGGTKELEPVVLLSLLVVLLILFGPLCDALGGASFNLSANIALFAAGHETETASSVALRLPAQTVGAVLGALAVLEVMPIAYHHTLGKPELAPNVSLYTGMMAEGAVTGVMNVVVVWSVYSHASGLLKSAVLLTCTILLILAGAPYTGPYMNPINAFGWAYVHGTHQTMEHFLVYWAAPMVASLLGALFFRLVWTPPEGQTKKVKGGHPEKVKEASGKKKTT